MIDHVEELGSKLDVEGVGDALNPIVFEYGRIEVYQPRPNQRVAS